MIYLTVTLRYYNNDDDAEYSNYGSFLFVKYMLCSCTYNSTDGNCIDFFFSVEYIIKYLYI